MEPAELLLASSVGVVMVTCRQLKKRNGDTQIWTFRSSVPESLHSLKTVNTPAWLWLSRDASSRIERWAWTGVGDPIFLATRLGMRISRNLMLVVLTSCHPSPLPASLALIYFSLLPLTRAYVYFKYVSRSLLTRAHKKCMCIHMHHARLGRDLSICNHKNGCTSYAVWHLYHNFVIKSNKCLCTACLVHSFIPPVCWRGLHSNMHFFLLVSHLVWEESWLTGLVSDSPAVLSTGNFHKVIYTLKWQSVSKTKLWNVKVW